MGAKSATSLMASFGVAFLALGATGVRVGRHLLDIDVAGSSTVSTNFTIYAYGVSGHTPGNSCYITGFPGSRADSVVSGPLVVSVPYGNVSLITFGNPDQSEPPTSSVVFYNATGAASQLASAENSTYGLYELQFTSNASDPQPQTASILAGLVEDYPTNPSTNYTCLVNVTFTTAPPSPVPAPAPNAPARYGLECTSRYPSNPCYCQGNYCFNFAGGSTNTNCFTPQGSSCTPTTLANPTAMGFYNVAPGPVCNCTSLATAG